MFNAVMTVEDILNKVYETPAVSLEEIKYLLSLEDAADIGCLFSFADKVREEFMGRGVLLRGLVEFSNYCDNSCFYCGLNKHNIKLKRYRMSFDEILACIDNISSLDVKTVVLQSGEDEKLDPLWLADIIKKIKKSFNMAVTLSLGEKSREEYMLWRNAGADRYLLRVETTNPSVYSAAHAGRRLESRLKCLDDLIDLGYQAGSGIMVGLKGQTIDSIARDILFFMEKDFDMIGIGPFIPHHDTVFKDDSPGDVRMTLKTLAVTRIVTRNAHMPATTALGSAGADYRIDGLNAGANVLMPNFTPGRYRKLYEIYPGKICLDETSEKCLLCMSKKTKLAGRFVDYSIGHSIKNRLSN